MSSGGAFDKRNIDQKLADNVVGQFTNIAGSRPTGKYLTGARVTLRINKKLAGFAFGITWKIDTQQMEINTIDDYLPAEIAPTRIHVSGSISSLHIPGQSPTKELSQSNVLSFLAHKYITIEARDSQTDELLFYTTKAVITSRQEDLQAGQLAKMTLQFMAIGWLDELVPTLPEGINTVQDTP
ncbi:MAG: hypothetical protein Q9M19_05640 [Mariprofundaceae bacterium]|nr:hypothetical protein [Mariprofundaceae bacterium]